MFLISVISGLILLCGTIYFCFSLFGFDRFDDKRKRFSQRASRVGIVLIILIVVSVLVNGYFQMENKVVVLEHFGTKAVVESQSPSSQMWPPKYDYIIKTFNDGFYKVTAENKKIVSITKTSPEVKKTDNHNYFFIIVVILFLLVSSRKLSR